MKNIRSMAGVASVGAVLGVAALWAPVAGAATTPITFVGNNASFTDLATTPTFSDLFTFTAPSSGTAGALAQAFNFSLNGTSGAVTFSTFSLENTTTMTSWAGSTSGGSASLSLVPFVSGDSYALTVNGNTAAGAPGSYAGLIQIAPVPEPSEWALMLLGGAVIGGLALRRRAGATGTALVTA